MQKNKPGYIFISNVLLSFAVLTKPVLVYFWIPNLLFLLYIFYENRKLIITASGLILPLVVLSLSLYNYYTTGYFHYLSSKQISLLGYNSAFLNVKAYGEEEGTKRNIEVRKKLDTIKIFSKLMEEEEKIGYENLMAHKIEFFEFQLGGMINFFLDPGRFDITNFLRIKENNNKGLLYTFTKDGYTGVFKFIIQQPIYIILYIILMSVVNIILSYLFLTLFLLIG